MSKPLLCRLFDLKNYKQLVVGYSGGLDSTVLLHALMQEPALAAKILAVHIHHGLSPNADLWEAHCKSFCETLGIPFLSRKVQIASSNNIEQQARDARYAVFCEIINTLDIYSQQLDFRLGASEQAEGVYSQYMTDGERTGNNAENSRTKSILLLGHHADDQAETVLYRLLRGSGVDGLAAMKPCSTFQHISICRPFLSYSKAQLKQYALQQHLAYIEDESNQNLSFDRNYLRHQLLPNIEQRFPQVQQQLQKLAQHSQEAQENLQALAFLDCPALSAGEPRLCLEPLLDLPLSRLKNVLRTWLKQCKQAMPSQNSLDKIIHEVIFSKPEAKPQLSLGEYWLRRYQKKIYLLPKKTQVTLHPVVWENFPEPLSLPGGILSAMPTEEGLHIPSNITPHIQYRPQKASFFWRQQHKSLKNIFQTLHMPPWERETWPLLYLEDTLAAIPNYLVSDHFYRKNAKVWRVTYKEHT
ncbi:MAG: tRNA lysidine(34) synthetase TilS [Legionellaceae bacterium]|nr:tRNA lysidine(34) synthetase TilS [Legionellaceae bacterium]